MTFSTRVRQPRYWKGWVNLLAGRTRLSSTSSDGSPDEPCAPEPSSDTSIGRAPAQGAVIQPPLPYVASRRPTYREISHLNRTCQAQDGQPTDSTEIKDGFDSHHPLHSRATPGTLRQPQRREVADLVGDFRAAATAAGPCRCRGLPGVAPAFALTVALDLGRKFQVRIRGRERHPSTRHKATHYNQRRGWTSAVGQKRPLASGRTAPIQRLQREGAMSMNRQHLIA